jgi:hypothetical protein
MRGEVHTQDGVILNTFKKKWPFGHGRRRRASGQ